LGNIQRLDKLLSDFGYGTRKEVKQFVKNGLVLVDGIRAKDASMHVDPEKSVIEVQGEVLQYRKYIYIMMNKPQDVISATFDNRKRTVIDLLPDKYSCFSLFPAGRLDIDTEGLVLLTNDGQLAHRLLSPKKHVPKKYYALVEGDVNDEDVRKFSEGVILDDGYKTLPAKLDILSKHRNNSGWLSEIELVIHEGKFHQVKRMFMAVGKKVKYLKRVQMGGLKLDESLKPGQWRELTEDEIKLLETGIDENKV